MPMPAPADDGRPEGLPEASPQGVAGDQPVAAGASPQGQGAGGDGATVDRFKLDPGLLGRVRGGLTAPQDRRKALKLYDSVIAAGALAGKVAARLGLGLTTLQRFWSHFTCG